MAECDIQGGKDINTLAAHVDLIPTLANLCGLSIPKDMILDGIDLSPVLLQKEKALVSRTVFMHNRQGLAPSNGCGSKLYHER